MDRKRERGWVHRREMDKEGRRWIEREGDGRRGWEVIYI